MKNLILLLTFASTVFSAYASTFHVRTTGLDTNDGLTWANSFQTLQKALSVANAGDDIYVAEGTYYPDEGPGQTNDDSASTFNLISGVAVFGGFSATGDPSLPDAAPSAHPTILSGNLEQSGEYSNGTAYHVLTADSVNNLASIDGCIITKGNAISPTAPHFRGGGLYCANTASPTITNCYFKRNNANQGGAIYSIGSTPSIINCFMEGNSASLGGAIFNDTSGAKYTNCLFIGNISHNSGGAIYDDELSNTFLTNCTFFQNYSNGPGGAIFHHSINLIIQNCIIWDNTEFFATTSSMGASVSSNSSPPHFERCLIQNWSKAALDAGQSSRNNLEPSDPLFVDIDDFRLKLSPTSPAVNKGASNFNSTVTDLAGNPRIVDMIDLGAYEYQVPLADYHVKPSGDDTNDGLSWGTAFRTIHKALSIVSRGGNILVAEGTYYPDEGPDQIDNDRNATFNLIFGVTIYGGFPATGNPGFTDRDPSDHPSILSGDLDQDGDISDNAINILTADGVDYTAALNGFTITLGNADLQPGNVGGGLLCLNTASPTITKCSFLQNSADSGGAIFNDASSPVITDCFFQSNSSDFGGAIYNSQSSSPSITNCSFQNNTAGTTPHSGGAGGAIRNQRSSSSIINCSFQNNSATIGGAIFNDSSTDTITNCSFVNNVASGTGGAIYSEFLPSPTVTNCILWGNSENGNTTTQGASFADTYTAALTFSHCLVQNWSKADLDTTGTPNTNLEPSDPLFRDAANGDLSLSTGSPAIDSGDNAANSATTDLAGNPRIVAIIDLGPFEADLLTAIWASHDDNDGNPYGVEMALGTDPSTGDLHHANNLIAPVFNASGHAALTFGHNPSAPPGTQWILYRSTTLASGSFLEIYRYNGTSHLVPAEYTITPSLGGGTFTIIDQDPPEDGAYYRFGSDYLQTP